MKKILSTFALAIVFVNCCFADPIFVAVKTTPYDHQMRRVRGYLGSGGRSGSRVSLLLVNRWMTELRCIPYGYHNAWQTPGQIRGAAAADCKGKAVALYHRMKANGAANVRLVIGKRTRWSRSTHAWVQWNTAHGSYVLDPTYHFSAKPTSQNPDSYLPLYAYSGGKKYRASSSAIAGR